MYFGARKRSNSFAVPDGSGGYTPFSARYADNALPMVSTSVCANLLFCKYESRPRHRVDSAVTAASATNKARRTCLELETILKPLSRPTDLPLSGVARDAKW